MQKIGGYWSGSEARSRGVRKSGAVKGLLTRPYCNRVMFAGMSF